MKLSLLPLLACPDCRSDIRFAQSDPAPDGIIINGMIECTGCRRSFVVQRRIPQMLPKNISHSLKHELAVRDDNVSEEENNLGWLAFSSVAVPFTLRYLELGDSQAVLEAGCGIGRYSEQIGKKVSQLVAVDTSFKSLLANDVKLQASGLKNYHLIQADSRRLPLKDNLFDRALSTQIIDHIAVDEERVPLLQELRRSVRPVGSVVISALQYSRWTKEKSGEDAEGIPFTRFTEEELVDLLSTTLTVKSVVGTLIYQYVVQCSPMAVDQPASFA